MASLASIEARLRSRIWQAIAQGDVDTSNLPREQLESLVDTAVEAALLEMDDVLEGQIGAAEAEAPQISTGGPLADEEQILWQGRPLMSLNERYIITTERVRVIRGLVGRDADDVELVRIQDIEHTQTLGERMLQVGDVTLRTVDASTPQVTLRNVRDPEAVHEIIRRAMLNARRATNFGFRDEM